MRFAADRAGARPAGGTADPPRRGAGSRLACPGLAAEDGGRGPRAAGRSDGTGRGRVAAGERVPQGEVPAGVADLEKKVRKVMHLTRLRWAMAFALAVVVIGAGVTAGVSRALAAADDDPKVKAELKKFQGTWVFIYAEKAGEEQERSVIISSSSTAKRSVMRISATTSKIRGRSNLIRRRTRRRSTFGSGRQIIGTRRPCWGSTPGTART